MTPRKPRVDHIRRRLVGGVGGVLAASSLSLPSLARPGGWSPRTSRRSALFTLGVASGDPQPRRVTLWTRLSPDPLNGGGMDEAAVEVTVEVASDPDFRDVVRSGTVMALPEAGHAVSVTVPALTPNTFYWYRFSALGETSRVGRTRTFPSRFEQPEQMRFALASCQNYTAGFYAAYRDMADQDLDFVAHTGDYIYEGAADEATPESRRHVGPECTSVVDYRNRYAQYRLDENLQDAHAAFPWIVTWDDHEVDNNYAALSPEDDQLPEDFSARRTAAYPGVPRKHAVRPATNVERRQRAAALPSFHLRRSRSVPRPRHPSVP
ncbi:MAG: alkaline phosphatase D family protein [Pseudomonadota bacterium]